MNTRRVELGLRSETIRRANLSAVVRELHLDGPLSRSQLGLRTGLSRSAIRDLIGELSAAGLVEETSGAPDGAPGRPSALVMLRPNGAVVLALGIAVDSLSVAVVGIGGDVLRSRRVPRSRGRASAEDTITDLCRLAAELYPDASPIRGSAPTDEALVGVAVAVAGIVRRDDGVVVMAPNLGWRDVPLASLVEKELRTKQPVLVANEADVGALAEHRRGAGAGVEDLLFIFGEVGVGGGLIVDGRPMTGATGYGLEIGHLPLNSAGERCGCGSTGCWETQIGERALLALAQRPIDAGREGVEQVLEAAAAGDTLALGALEQVGRWLGRGIAALTNVLNPRLVVLGGFFERIYPFVEQPLVDEVDRLALPSSRAVLAIVPASLGIDAPLLGAAELAFERLLDNPASLVESQNHTEWRVVA